MVNFYLFETQKSIIDKKKFCVNIKLDAHRYRLFTFGGFMPTWLWVVAGVAILLFFAIFFGHRRKLLTLSLPVEGYQPRPVRTWENDKGDHPAGAGVRVPRSPPSLQGAAEEKPPRRNREEP